MNKLERSMMSEASGYNELNEMSKFELIQLRSELLVQLSEIEAFIHEINGQIDEK